MGISIEYTLAIACSCTESSTKVSQTSPFLKQIVIVCSLFSHCLGCVCCVLCVRKEMWNTTERWCEKPLDDRIAMSSFGGWDSRGRPAVYCHTLLQEREWAYYISSWDSRGLFKRMHPFNFLTDISMNIYRNKVEAVALRLSKKSHETFETGIRKWVLHFSLCHM